MTKEEAKNLVVKTFEQSFDEARFLYFIKNLLNGLDESKTQVWAGNYIPESYRAAIKSYKRIGQYTDKKNNVIDILTVNVKRDNTLERARTLQRNFIARHLKQRNHEAALVAFYTEEIDDWRFSLVIMEFSLTKTKVEIELSPAKRYSFLVGKNERSHTAQNQFVNLLIDKNDKHSLNDIEQAFNIETVTKEFFLEYRDLFIRTKTSLDKILKSDSKVKEEFNNKGIDSVNFSKKLLGQIVFLYFLQKKGWFGVGRNEKWGEGSKKFLRELFESKHGKHNNFYNDILEPLFYEALRIDRSHDDHYYSRFDCKIPFLNGGLFDPIGDYNWVQTDITLPNDLFSNNKKTTAGDVGDGILDIFDRYNFTVIEDEPLEKEVAIDPELLGKAYEKFNAIRSDNFDEYLKVLKSGKKGEETKFNKQYGVYYTPREIVHYMCRESLINYLASEFSDKSDAYQKIDLEQLDAFGNTSRKGQLPLEAEYKSVPHIPESDFEILINSGELYAENEAVVEAKGKETDTYYYKLPESVRKNALLIDEKLANVLICDPAVGSGAFPVGMMHEIVSTRNLLTVFIKENSRNKYHFKRECIERSLYGVDIDEGAVEIAKLRLWLSLVVDEQDINNIKPLPNLDYKIVRGNSLLGFPENWQSDISKSIDSLKLDYLGETRPQRKREIKEEIDKQINKRLENSESTYGYKIDFDFKTFFSEVYHLREGFNIIIANPPYSTFSRVTGGSNKNSKSDNKEKSILKSIFPNSAEYKISLYALFMNKGISLLANHGLLCFITPDSFLTGRYFSKLRNFILIQCSIERVLIFTNDFWESATIGLPTITLLKKEANSDIRENYKTTASISDSIVNLTKNTMQSYSYSQEYFYETPYNRFRLLFDAQSYKIIKKIEDKSLTLENIIDMHVGIRPKIGYDKIQSPIKKSDQWQPGYVKGNEVNKYSASWSGNFINIDPKLLWGGGFDPKIISQKKLLMRKTGNDLIVGYDDSGLYHLDILHSIVQRDKNFDLFFIMAFLNSKALNYYYRLITLSFNRVMAQTNIETVLGLPVPINSNDYSPIITKMVKAIVQEKRKSPEVDTTSIEDRLDVIIYWLYKLDYNEIKIIDPNIGEIISEEEYENYQLN